ncbi:hypothetical protein VB796_13625 [Arcicella sp. LKC2W]|uniref:hypothetical protein n=1 Tax=Arcicella sp. LKC2W TaxID=2984198 RepID=UPI002B2191D1|nr:hypothetical protein [Arcicella sp. LKC2W]MEA5460090.1 hypothetical protein [Arcicella sp. LKC2W]
MNRKNILTIAGIALLATACNYQKNNTIKQADLNENDAYVYGVHPDSAARQTKNKYASKPESEIRANKIREKLFNDSTNAQGN